jgi:nucleotide-binding universal stress UspA family protein
MAKKILCPVDFSPGARHAMEVAARLAIAADAELVLAHAWYLPPLAFASETGFPPEAVDGMIDEDQRALAAAVAEATALGARVTARFLSGVPWDQLVQTARADPSFELIVMGTHGRTGMTHLLLGSVAQLVVRHAPCSVMVARPGTPVAPFTHILCPIDFSDSARFAVARAAALVAPGGAGITLLHVIEPPPSYGDEPVASDFLDTVGARATQLVARWADELRAKVDVPVAAEVRIGSPAAHALAVLEADPTFDLVVMGSHGRTGLGRALLGSVAEKVVRHAPCPVLVARDRSAV